MKHEMIEIPDRLVLNLVVSACRATLGPGELAMPEKLLLVAHVQNWASLTLCGQAAYAMNRYEYVTQIRKHQTNKAT